MIMISISVLSFRIKENYYRSRTLLDALRREALRIVLVPSSQVCIDVLKLVFVSHFRSSQIRNNCFKQSAELAVPIFIDFKPSKACTCSTALQWSI